MSSAHGRVELMPSESADAPATEESARMSSGNLRCLLGPGLRGGLGLRRRPNEWVVALYGRGVAPGSVERTQSHEELPQLTLAGKSRISKRLSAGS